MFRRTHRLFWLGLTCLLCGCQPLLQSTPIADNDDSAQDGLIYYLPRYLYELAVAPGDEKAQAKLAPKVAGDSFNAFKPDARPAAMTPEAIPTIATITVPKTSECPRGATITVKGPIAIGDEAHPILLSRADSSFLDEELGIVISPSGIIRSADSLTTGQFDEVVRILAQIAMSAVGGAPMPPTGTMPQPKVLENVPEKEAANCITKTQVIDFDPTDKRPSPSLADGKTTVSLARMSRSSLKVLNAVEDKKEIDVLNASTPYGGLPTDPISGKTPKIAGIYYRALETQFFKLSNTNPAIDINLALPTPTGKLGYVKYMGSLIADGDGTAVRFKDGVPVSYDVTAPSDALALVKIPLDILNSVLQMPMNVLTFRTQEVTAEKSLTKAQTDLLTEVLALKAKQDELDKANKPPAPEGSGQ
jgi:hypothetical protein